MRALIATVAMLAVLSIAGCSKDKTPPGPTPTPTPPPPTKTQGPCDQLTRAECLGSTHCTLHWIAESTYECRADDGPCQVGIGQNDRAACEKVGSCTWDPGMCYCPFPGYGQTAVPDKQDPNGAGACACGGGQPSMCLPVK
jgi:hypothetical protein